jgi:hypothetical protein
MLVAASTLACEYRQRLDSIVAQRHAAVCLRHQRCELTALDHQVSACRESYIGAAVTEIATLRALLDGPNRG